MKFELLVSKVSGLRKYFALFLTILVLSGCASRNVHIIEKPIISVEERSRNYVVLSESGEAIIPGVAIYPDGRCISCSGDGKISEKELRPADVTELIRYFETEGLPFISDASLHRALDSQQPPFVSVDGTITRIVIDSKNWKTDVSANCLKSCLEAHPKLLELITLERCVEKIYQTGGLSSN